MRYNNPHVKNLNIKLSIMNEQGTELKTTLISLEDYIDETIGKKCQNVADNIVSSMMKNIYNEIDNNILK